MSNVRYISNLTRETYALILAGGRGSRLHELTDWRAKPALYFGGKFRIIDFPLSNCINSGIRRVGVVTQYKSHSLIRHVMRGWGHFKKELGESVEILPASQRYSENWYQGTADAVFQNIDIIRHELPKYVMVLSGDHVYRMDYAGLLAAHAESGADMTVSCLEVPVAEAAGAFGVMEVDDEMRILGFEEKPKHPKHSPGNPEKCLASMGNYVFNTEFLFEQLKKDAQNANSDRDFGKDIIPSIIEKHKVFAYPFKSAFPNEQAYWRDVGTLDSFWQANMELLSPTPALNLYDAKWPIGLIRSNYLPLNLCLTMTIDAAWRWIRLFLAAVLSRARPCAAACCLTRCESVPTPWLRIQSCCPMWWCCATVRLKTPLSTGAASFPKAL